MNFSRQTLELFDRLLSSVTLTASAPDFEEATVLVLRAQRELAEALAASSGQD